MQEILEERDGRRLLMVPDEDARDPRKEFDNYGDEEVRAWQDGDVWGYVIEERIGWVRADGSAETMETWETVDSCFGFYGREWAERSAREAFEG
jgi:hypothetical protein